MNKLPNILTVFRLILVPVFFVAFFSGAPYIYSIFIFLTAGITDILDGYIARRFDLITKIGIILDPLADKLMLVTVLTCLVMGKFIPLFVLVVITLKELFMIFCGILLFRRGTVIPSDLFGKAATFLFYISIFVIIFDTFIGTILIYISLISSLIALANYVIVYFKYKESA